MISAVFALETDLARASMTRVERRDPNVVYNLHTVESLAKLAPGLELGGVLCTRSESTRASEFNVTSPKFAQQVAHAAAADAACRVARVSAPACARRGSAGVAR